MINRSGGFPLHTGSLGREEWEVGKEEEGKTVGNLDGHWLR